MAFLKFYLDYSPPFSDVQAMPTGFIKLNELKQKCLDRIHVLSLVEKNSQKFQAHSMQWANHILDDVKVHHPDLHLALTGRGCSLREMKARQSERASYFILAHIIVHMKHKKINKWFILNETRLFVCHFISMSLDSRRKFLLTNNLCCESIPRNFHLKKEIKEVYKVPWKYVLCLVATRYVHLSNGFAYLDVKDLSVVAASHRFASLRVFLQDVRINLSNLTLDSRFMDITQALSPVVEKLFRQPTWLDYIDHGEVSLSSLHQLSGSFPPCMSRMYSSVVGGRHLRHRGRQQFIPFLKDIGLTLNDALQFFRSNFLKDMTEKEYNRGRYDYFIKYVYGEVGQKMGHHCPPCEGIQREPESNPKDCHGCPLKTVSNAQQLLETSQYQYLTQEKEEILHLVRSGLPTEACAALFMVQNEIEEKDEEEPCDIISPIQHYVLSRNMNKYNNIILYPG